MSDVSITDIALKGVGVSGGCFCYTRQAEASWYHFGVSEAGVRDVPEGQVETVTGKKRSEKGEIEEIEV